jgi:predicted transcriptional regulator
MAIKAKEIKIEVKPFEEGMEEVLEVAKKLDKGKPIEKEDKIVVDSLDALRKVLTPERIKLLHTIKEENPDSIYELSKLVKRDRKSVITDIEILEELGLVEIKKEVIGKRIKSKPSVSYSRMEIGIEI